MASGIEKVIVEIVGKADSAINAFRGAGDAADKFGKDSDKAHAALSKVSGLLEGAVVAGAAAAAYGLLDAAKAAAAEEQEMAVLKNTLEQAAGANDAIVASTESWITAQQNATGISDGKLRPALSNLVVATNSIGTAQGLMATAMDISVAKGLDLETVTTAMAKAYNGNTGALSKLGIATKDAEGKALSFEQIMATCNATFGGAAAAAADTTAGKMAILGAQFADIKETVGTALLPVLTTLGNWLSQAVTWFGSLSPTMQAAIPIVAAVGLALGALVVTVAPLLTALPALGVAFAAISGPIGIAIAAVAALIAVGVLVYKNWDEIKIALAAAWEAIKDAFDACWGAIQTAWTAMWTWVQSLPGRITGVFADALTWLLEHGRSIITGLFTGAKEIWETVVTWLGTLYGLVTDFFVDSLTWLLDHGKNIMGGLFGGLTDVWNSVSSWFSEIYGKVVGFFSNAISWLKEKGREIISGLWDGNKSVWENVVSWFDGLGGLMQGCFGGAASWLTSIGRSIMDGLLSGIKSAWNSVANFLSGLGAKIKALKGPIEEDRKLLTPEGEAIMEGLGIGLDNGWNAIEAKLAKYGKDIKAWGSSLHSVQDVVPGTTGGSIAAPSSSVVGQIGISNKALKRIGDMLFDIKVQDTIFDRSVQNMLDKYEPPPKDTPAKGLGVPWEEALTMVRDSRIFQNLPGAVQNYVNDQLTYRPPGASYGAAPEDTRFAEWGKFTGDIDELVANGGEYVRGSGQLPSMVYDGRGHWLTTTNQPGQPSATVSPTTGADSRAITINVTGMSQMDTVRAMANALATV